MTVKRVGWSSTTNSDEDDDHDGDVCLVLPGINLSVHHMFANSAIEDAYKLLKVLKVLSGADVSNYLVKKIIFQENYANALADKDYIGITKHILRHRDLRGKYGNASDCLGRGNVRLDMDSFPIRGGDGKLYLHVIWDRKICQLVRFSVAWLLRWALN